MNEFKGTPGKWAMSTLPIELRNTDSAAAIYRDTQHGSTLIADVSRSPGDEKADANAHLIASSPELLEALQELLSHAPSIEDLGGDQTAFRSSFGVAIAKSESAINKALGNEIKK